MNIGQVILKSGFEGEIVFKDKFLKMNRIEQLDILQDVISDLSAMYEHILESEDGDTAQDFLNGCDEEDNQHFTIQRQLYSED